MIRSRAALALGGVYLAFGFLGPVLAKYMQDIVKHVQSGITITVAPPTPGDGIANYVNQVNQTGLVVVVVVAAAAFAFDSRRGLSTFLRTRASSMWVLVGPRFVVVSSAAILAYSAGTLAAWYETALLIGPPRPSAVLAGLLCGAVYLVFAVAVVAAASSVARGTLGTVGLALAVLLLLPIAGSLSVLHDWLPSTLATAPVELFGATYLSDYAGALLVATASAAALVAIAVQQLRRREV